MKLRLMAAATLMTVGMTIPSQSITPTNLEEVSSKQVRSTPTVAPVLPDINPDTGYYDVQSGDWFSHYVKFVTNQGIMSGANGGFFPNSDCDRGTIADALANYSGGRTTVATPESFQDVEGTGFESAIAWCLDAGIMSGYDETHFGTTDGLTREQFAVALRSFALYQGDYSVDEEGLYLDRLEKFNDRANVSFWAEDALSWAVKNNLMMGDDKVAISPQGKVTRAEVAAIICQYEQVF